MQITEITDERTKTKYFEQMLDWARIAKAGRSVVDTHRGIARWIIPAPVTWMHYRTEPLGAAYVAEWKRAHGEWRHAGKGHNQLGMAYAAWLETNPGIKRVSLGDAPDVTAEFHYGSWLRGDIGRCSDTALMESLVSSQQADMWVTVLNECEHIGLVFKYDVGRSILAATEEARRLRAMAH